VFINPGAWRLDQARNAGNKSKIFNMANNDSPATVVDCHVNTEESSLRDETSKTIFVKPDDSHLAEIARLFIIQRWIERIEGADRRRRSFRFSALFSAPRARCSSVVRRKSTEYGRVSPWLRYSLVSTGTRSSLIGLGVLRTFPFTMVNASTKEPWGCTGCVKEEEYSNTVDCIHDDTAMLQVNRCAIKQRRKLDDFYDSHG
jgi:hypothetical protein